MKLFLERLKVVGTNIAVVLIGIALAILFLWIFFRIPANVMNVIGTIAGVIIIIFFGSGALLAIGSFVHWLFIEPFRRRK